MASSVSTFPAHANALTAAPASRLLGHSEQESSLAAITPGREALVTSVVLEPDLAAWVAAVGIREGERLTVLRRAVFGGPIHVRTHAGGEFAIARSLARAILVRLAPP